MKRIVAAAALWLAAITVSPLVFAQQAVQVKEPWARATAGKVGGVFLTLAPGATADRLTGAQSPVAGKVELHTTVKDGDVMRMRPVNAIEVKPGAPVELKPGGLHIMLVDLKRPLKQGDKIPLQLTFEKAGTVSVTVEVKAPGAMPGPGGHNHGGHSDAAPAMGTDTQQVVAVMKKTWDQPGSPLAVEPVVVRGDTAIAGWIQGETGGRALLRKRHGSWQVALCSGDGLTKPEFLQQAGLKPADAQALAKDVAAAEARLPAKQLAMLSLFEGTVKMDEHGNHPPGHHASGTGHDGHKH